MFCDSRDGATFDGATFGVPEELETLCEAFSDWLIEEDFQETIDRRINKIGGEVERHS